MPRISTQYSIAISGTKSGKDYAISSVGICKVKEQERYFENYLRVCHLKGAICEIVVKCDGKWIFKQWKIVKRLKKSMINLFWKLTAEMTTILKKKFNKQLIFAF